MTLVQKDQSVATLSVSLLAFATLPHGALFTPFGTIQYVYRVQTAMTSHALNVTENSGALFTNDGTAQHATKKRNVITKCARITMHKHGALCTIVSMIHLAPGIAL